MRVRCFPRDSWKSTRFEISTRHRPLCLMSHGRKTRYRGVALEKYTTVTNIYAVCHQCQVSKVKQNVIIKTIHLTPGNSGRMDLDHADRVPSQTNKGWATNLSELDLQKLVWTGVLITHVNGHIELAKCKIPLGFNSSCTTGSRCKKFALCCLPDSMRIAETWRRPQPIWPISLKVFGRNSNSIITKCSYLKFIDSKHKLIFIEYYSGNSRNIQNTSLRLVKKFMTHILDALF